MGQAKSSHTQRVDKHGVTIVPYLHQHRGYPYRHYSTHGILDYRNLGTHSEPSPNQHQQYGPENGTFLLQNFTQTSVPVLGVLEEHPEGLYSVSDVIPEPEPDYSVSSASDNARDSISDPGIVQVNSYENFSKFYAGERDPILTGSAAHLAPVRITQSPLSLCVCSPGTHDPGTSCPLTRESSTQGYSGYATVNRGNTKRQDQLSRPEVPHSATVDCTGTSETTTHVDKCLERRTSDCERGKEAPDAVTRDHDVEAIQEVDKTTEAVRPSAQDATVPIETAPDSGTTASYLSQSKAQHITESCEPSVGLPSDMDKKKMMKESMTSRYSERHEQGPVTSTPLSRNRPLMNSKAESRFSDSSSSVYSSSDPSTRQARSQSRSQSRSHKSGSMDRKKKKWALGGKHTSRENLADQWGEMVEELEGYNSHGAASAKTSRQSKSTDKRKVSRIKNMEQFDNVKQVFSRSMPLPMQMAPAGAHTNQIENVHNLSTQTWNVNTPLAANSNAGNTQMMAGSSQMNAGSGQVNSGSAHINIGSGQMMPGSSQMNAGTAQTTAGNAQMNTNSAHMSSSSYKTSAQNTRGGTEIPIAHSGMKPTYSRTNSSNSSSGLLKTTTSSGTEGKSSAKKSSKVHTQDKKSVKFDGKNTKGVDKQARHIVDDAITRALRALYGPSRRHSSKTAHQISTINSTAQNTHLNSQHNINNSHHNNAQFNQSAHQNAQYAHQNIQHDNTYQGTQGNQNMQQHALLQRQNVMNNVVNQRSVHERNIEQHLTKTTVLHPETARHNRGHRQSHTASHTANKGKQSTYDIDIMAQGNNRTHDTRASRLSSIGSTGSAFTPFPRNSVQYSAGRGQQHPNIRAASYTDIRGSPSINDIRDMGHVISPASASSLNVISSPTTTIPVWKDTEAPATLPKRTPHQHLPSPKKIDPPTITRGTVTKVLHGAASAQPSPSAAPFRGHPLQTSRSTSNILDTVSRGFNVTEPNSPQRAALPTYMTNPKNINVHLHHNTIVDGVDARHTIQSPVLMSPVSSLHSPPLRQFVQSVCIDGDQKIKQPLPRMIPSNPAPAITRLLPSPNKMTSLGINTNIRTWKSEDNLLMSPPVKQEETYVAYSNEPMIVGELEPMNQRPPQIQTHVDKNDTTLHMANNQTLNMFLFNQTPGQPLPAQSQLSPQTSEYNQQVKHITYYDADYCGDHEDVVTRHLRMGPEMSPKRETPPIPLETYKQYDIYHKQTQTLNVEPQPEPETETKIVKVERQRSAKKDSDRRKQTPVVHRETTHYVTKEREIERVPSESKKISDCSMQTDYVEPEIKYVDRPVPVYEQRIERYSPPVTPTPPQRSPSPPPRSPSPKRIQLPSVTNVSSEFHAPPLTVIRQVDRKQTLPRSPSPVIEPISATPLLAKEPEKTVAPADDQSSVSSEESFYEMHEVEEREQKISIAIMEELEFNLQRTQGEHTETLHLTESGEVPLKLPGMYETVVDRRKQKSTQIKDIQKGAEQTHQNATTGERPISTGPAPLMLPASMDAEGLSQTLGKQEYKSSPSAWKPGHFTDHVNLPEPSTESRVIHRSAGMRSRNQPTIVNRSEYPEHTSNPGNSVQQYEPIIYEEKHTRSNEHTPKKSRKQRSAVVIHRSGHPENDTNFTSHVPHSEPIMYEQRSHDESSTQNAPSRDRSRHTTTITRSKYPEFESTASNVKQSIPIIYEKKSSGSRTDHGFPSEYNTTLDYDVHRSRSATPRIQCEKGMEKSHSKSSRKFEVPQLWLDDDDTDIQTSSRRYERESEYEMSDPGTHTSRFYPDNIYFKQAEQENSIDEEVDIDAIFRNVALGKEIHGNYEDEDHHMVPTTPNGPSTDTLEREKKYVTRKMVQLQQPNITVVDTKHIESQPKMRTKIVKDDDGNMMKVTDLHKQLTTSVDYTDDRDLHSSTGDLSRHSSASESIAETGYVELQVEKIKVQPHKPDITNTPEAEVIEEMTSHYKPVVYDSQEQSIDIGATGALRAGQKIPVMKIETPKKKKSRNIKTLLMDSMSTHL